MKNLLTSSILFGTGLLVAGMWSSAGKIVAEPLKDPVALQKPNPEMRARMRDDWAGDRTGARATLTKATDLYAAIVKGEQGRVPEAVLAKAQCVAVIPDVMTGALIVGGSRGSGVASCKENGRWSEPAFLKLNSISLGAQIGGKSSDLVLFMVNPQAETALKAGKIVLGTDVSVAAGTFDRSMDTSAHGVIAYTRTEGAFAGASISGGTITGDDDNTTAFYGKDVKFAELLEGRVSVERNAQAERFAALLTK